MRNLKLLYSVKIGDASELAETNSLSVDCDTENVYCATKTEVVGLNPQSQEVLTRISLEDGGYLMADNSSKVVGSEYLPDQTSVCVATNRGDVLLCNIMSNEIECVGTVDSGIADMLWSPDQEIMVLATGQETLILMTREFDPLMEFPMHPDAFGEAKPITVGWGKKETQFHGSEGKQAAVKKKESTGAAFAWDDQKPRISWRGDGQYFVVSSINPTSGNRQLRVWTREGTLHSTSESLDGLEQALAWKPSGSLLASSQRKPNKHNIIFFEKNGLKHGEFTLPFAIKEVKVNELLWNTESTVLAVWCEGMEGVTPKSYVLLYTTGNYHWYLKQKLEFPPHDADRISAVTWDVENAYRMHIVCTSGLYLQYTWSWCTNSSSDDQTLVAVIDGDKVLMTPLNRTVIPPPYSAYQLQQSTAVSQVTFAPPPNSSAVAILLQNNQIVVYDYLQELSEKVDESVKIGVAGGTGFKVCCRTPVSRGIYNIQGDLSDEVQPLKIGHLQWLGADLLIFATLDITGSTSCLHVAEINNAKKEIFVKDCLEVDMYVISISVNQKTGTVVLQLKDGTLLKYMRDSNKVAPFECGNSSVRFPLPCSQFQICELGGQEVALGLTDRFRFYVNDTEIANNCTSFGLHRDFLLLTTHSHTLRCICRKTSLNVLPSLSDGKAHPFDESIRRVERGSRLVCVNCASTEVVLQMPRGNLETIHPRALVLSAVRSHLDQLDFKGAFILMRKHRINMNLLYDHNPDAFLDNVASFVEQIDNVNHINLFLTDLQEEDVTVTMYTAAYNREATATSGKTNKVDIVCDAVRHTLEKLDPDRFLLSILTAHVRKTNPELEVALQKVNNLAKVPGTKVGAEEALKYLLFLVDVNELYDIALGTYDFDLVLMVAEKSQKDPKEYLPYLNELRRMEDNYRYYTIAKHLRRYHRALKHIADCGREHFAECLTLIKDQKLYTEALKLFAVTSQEYKDTSVAYGDFLMEKKYYEEAGLAFSKAGELELAQEAFQKNLNWRQALCMACRLNQPKETVTKMARMMATQLRQIRKHTDAACLYEQYVDDFEEAIVTLIEGSAWEEALRLMYKYNRTDFIDTNLKEALTEAYSNHMTWIKETEVQYDRHRKRLEVVREEKERKRIELLEGGGNYNDADADLFSDTSSATGESVLSSRYSTTESNRSTILTKTSGRTRKSARKTERKKWSLKEGSAYEEFALVEALSKLIQQVEDTKNEINSLLRMLVLFFYESKASDLQEALEALAKTVDESVNDIWNADQDSTSAMMLGPESTANTIALAMQQGGRTGTQPSPQDPVLRAPPPINKDVKWKLYTPSTNKSS